MKIAFTAKGDNWDAQIDPRFGRTEWLLFYDEETDTLSSYDNSSVDSVAHGAGPRTVQVLVENKAEVLITGNGPGGNAAAAIKQSGIEVKTGAGALTVRQAYQAYKKSELTAF